MMITLIREHMTHVGIRFIKLAEEHDMQANVVFEDAASGKSFEHDLVRVMFKLRTIESKQRQFIMQVPYELRDFKDEQVVAQDVFQGLYHNDIYNKGANGTVSLFVNYMEAMKIAEAFKTPDTNHPDIDPSDRCNVCQVKGLYHKPNDDGTPSGEVRRVIDKFGYNVAYDHEFVRMPGEDYDDE